MTSTATPAKITLSAVAVAWKAWRSESDRPESTYRSRMVAYGRAADLSNAYRVQELGR